MRRAVMVLAAVLALMFGGASIAMGADHNRPEGNENSPCAEDHPGAASEKNPHCTGEGPPGHQRENRETDTVAAEQDAGETEETAAEEEGGDEVAEEDGDDDAAEEEGGDAVEGDAGAEADGDADEVEVDAGAEADGDAEEGDAAADEDDGDDVAAGADALEDGGVVTDLLLIMDDFFGDLFVTTDEADQVQVG